MRQQNCDQKVFIYTQDLHLQLESSYSEEEQTESQRAKLLCEVFDQL
jgi:hypothetical protein